MQNRICSLLGIRYPIIQAPMNWVSGAALTAAVSAAGGMGTLGPNAGADKINPDVESTGELARQQIHKVRSLTDKPFALCRQRDGGLWRRYEILQKNRGCAKGGKSPGSHRIRGPA